MPSSAYMSSVLVRQQQLLQADFAKRYDHSWLVWEAGPWRPAKSAREANTSSTQLDEQRSPARPTGIDSTCFALQPPRFAGALTIGRDSGNYIVVNDLTFSRHALNLFHDTHGWLVEPHAEAHGETVLDGVPIRPGLPVSLVSGSTLTAGAVTLRYYEPAEFLERLRQSA